MKIINYPRKIILQSLIDIFRGRWWWEGGRDFFVSNFLILLEDYPIHTLFLTYFVKNVTGLHW